MLRTIEQIELDYKECLANKHKRKFKQFYKDCLLLVKEGYDEDYFIEEKKRVTRLIQKMNERIRKNNPYFSGTETKELYEQDLKQQRRYLKTLKYLIINENPKEGHSKPGHIARIRAFWDSYGR